jgi:cyanophycinase-like exopeptidase
MNEHPEQRAAMLEYERNVWPTIVRIERRELIGDVVAATTTGAVAVLCLIMIVTSADAFGRGTLASFVFICGFLLGALVVVRHSRRQRFAVLKIAHEEAVYRLAMDDGDEGMGTEGEWTP